MSNNLENLVKIIRDRKNQDDDKSYTSSLLSGGLSKCIDKMEEEFGELKKSLNDKWEIYTHGGRTETGIDALDFAKKMEDNGAGELLITSMDQDGTQKGYDIKLISEIEKNVNIPIIASGGVGTLEHLFEGVKYGKANAVLAASIFHYGIHSIQEAKQYLDSKGIPVRI